MSFLRKIVDVATGGLAKEVKELVTAYFPPDMPVEKRMEFEQKAQELEFNRARAADDATNKASELINQRVAEYEGTASDLKSIWLLGPLMIFIRGTQRIAWGYATLWIDWLWFTGKLGTLADQQSATLYVINFLVLGFLFGERAIQNVAPYIADVFKAKLGKT